MTPEEIEAVLEAHQYGDSYTGPYCSCGASFGTSSLVTVQRAKWHRAHIAEALVALMPVDLTEGYNAQVRHGRTHWVRAEKAEAALAELRAKVEALLADKRIRHNHAYPMEIGAHHCPSCDLEDELRALLDGA